MKKQANVEKVDAAVCSMLPYSLEAFTPLSPTSPQTSLQYFILSGKDSMLKRGLKNNW